jgi:hypothetical protein
MTALSQMFVITRRLVRTREKIELRLSPLDGLLPTQDFWSAFASELFPPRGMLLQIFYFISVKEMLLLTSVKKLFSLSLIPGELELKEKIVAVSSGRSNVLDRFVKLNYIPVR